MQQSNSDTYQRQLIWTLSITFGVVFFDRNAANFLSPFIARDLGLSFTQVGLLSAGLSLTWALSGTLGGAISDRTGRRKLPLLIAICAFSICSALSGLAASFAALLATRLLMGISEGPILPVSQALLAEESAEENRGHNMGVMQNTGSAFLGSFLAPLVLVAIAQRLGWRAAFFLAAAPGLVMAAIVWRIVREPRRVQSHDSRDSLSLRRHYLPLLRYRNMALCTLISIVIVTWVVVGWAFLPQYYTQVLGFDERTMSWMMAVLGLSATSFAFIVPRLSDRFGRKPVVVAFCLIGALGPFVLLNAQAPPALLAVGIFIGWSASGTMPLFMGTIPAETVVQGSVATALGLVMGVGEVLGGVVGPTLAGMAADRWGLTAPLWIEVGCAIAGGLIALGLIETAPARSATVVSTRSAARARQ